MTNYIGELAALATAFCWSITSVSFESAGKKLGALNLNLIRLILGMIFLSIYTFITRGFILPIDASTETWKWLLLSGLVGVVIGDLLLFEAFVQIGARISMLIYASVPPISGVLAYIFLGESMTVTQIIGMFVTLTGIGIVILVRGDDKQKIKFAHPVIGILLAFGGALGQAAGYIIGKYGMSDYDAFASTQIRLLAGIFGFIIIFTIRGHWPNLIQSLKKKKGLLATTIGSFFGPFIGISLSLYAVQHVNPGVASTLISITPIILIPYVLFVKKEKVLVRELLGSLVTISGVAIMFII